MLAALANMVSPGRVRLVLRGVSLPKECFWHMVGLGMVGLWDAAAGRLHLAFRHAAVLCCRFFLLLLGGKGGYVCRWSLETAAALQAEVQ